jgi:hypothetical protein
VNTDHDIIVTVFLLVAASAALVWFVVWLLIRAF